MTKIFGLKTCDTCKKVVRAFKDADRDFDFVDVREEADLLNKIPYWIENVDVSVLLNTRSATWRNLSDEDKAKRDNGDLAGLLREYPALIKRPLIEHEGHVYVGWTKEVQFSVGL